MIPQKPHLFIASSQEARERNVVKAFSQALGKVAKCFPWYSVPEFRKGGSVTTFGALCTAATNYDYAVFLLTADDVIVTRKKKHDCPRDNVIFELGLFVASIGPQRVLAVVEGGKSLKFPSDVEGVTMPRFSTNPEELYASARQAASGFGETIVDNGFRKIDLMLASEWGYNTKKCEWEVDLCPARIQRARPTIGDWRICVAARVADGQTNIETDQRIAYTPVRSIPVELTEKLAFRIPGAKLRRSGLTAGTKIESRVLLVPPGLDFDPKSTLGHAVNCRCRNVESMSFVIGKG